MINMINHDGVRLQATALKQKRYGYSEMESISVEEFLADLSHCKNSENIVKLCSTIQESKVYEIREVNLDCGKSMPCKSYIMISTYHRTFVVSSGGSYSSKVVFSHDGEELFTVTNCATVTVIIS